MAVVAPGSKYSRNSSLMVVVLCVGFGAYCVYDGWVSEKYQRRNVDWSFTQADIKDPAGFGSTISASTDGVPAFVKGKLGPGAVAFLADAPSGSQGSVDEYAEKLVGALNEMLVRTEFYDEKVFAKVTLSAETQNFIGLPDKNEAEIRIRNRLLLADAFPKELAGGDWRKGVPNANLKFNRIWGPVVCLLVALYFLRSVVQTPRQRVVADEKGLTVTGRGTIAYGDIKKIDKRFFEKEGYFVVEYDQAGSAKQVKLSDRKFDSLGLLLDELVKQTGAAPAAQDDTNSAKGGGADTSEKA